MARKGYRYPLEFKDGTLPLAEGTDYVRSQLPGTLDIFTGERLGRPEQGSNLRLFSAGEFQPVGTALQRGIPDVRFQVQQGYSSDGDYLVTVFWDDQRVEIRQ